MRPRPINCGVRDLAMWVIPTVGRGMGFGFLMCWVFNINEAFQYARMVRYQNVIEITKDMLRQTCNIIWSTVTCIHRKILVATKEHTPENHRDIRGFTLTFKTIVLFIHMLTNKNICEKAKYGHPEKMLRTTGRVFPVCLLVCIKQIEWVKKKAGIGVRCGKVELSAQLYAMEPESTKRRITTPL